MGLVAVTVVTATGEASLDPFLDVGGATPPTPGLGLPSVSQCSLYDRKALAIIYACSVSTSAMEEKKQQAIL